MSFNTLKAYFEKSCMPRGSVLSSAVMFSKSDMRLSDCSFICSVSCATTLSSMNISCCPENQRQGDKEYSHKGHKERNRFDHALKLKKHMISFKLKVQVVYPSDNLQNIL